MFLRELNGEQQQAFFVLAREVINADERLSMNELESLEAIYRETGLPAETAKAPDTAIDLNYLFDTPRSRAVVLLELVVLAFADGVFDALENDTVSAIAERMELSEEVRNEVYNWARRYTVLLKEGSEIK